MTVLSMKIYKKLLKEARTDFTLITMAIKDAELPYRLQQIRLYRNLTQAECASWLGITHQSWGAKERGEAAGFSLGDIRLILDKTEIDARYLFGQIDSIADADLRLKRKDSYDDWIQRLEEMERHVIPAEKHDELAYRVTVNQPLRAIVDLLKNVEGGKLREIYGIIYGYMIPSKAESESEKGEEEEQATG